ncbi:hypothetical protein [Natrialba aegyptia]|uniref:Uncharacterized protein n=1 Tax=Natrialba aegyptia DSM 13077 TaxID=1227491 RepID=M0B8E5_9EURY|nr:hypothetical protein [Natrialba aegyptia]ELZ06782.1 hypothetical protein C480_07112 [Natrialba aegyptia DSM 13077]
MTRDSNRPIDTEQFVGGPVDEAPKIAPDYYCNSKQSGRTDDGKKVFKGYCSLRAGWGTDHVEEGRCKLHGGAIEGAGAPAHNQNGQTHGLRSNPQHYYESLDEEEQTFVDGISETILNRHRARYGDVDSLDDELAHRVAVKLHIVSKASDYVESESGLVQTISGREESAALLDELRQYDMSIFDDLEKLGVLSEPDEEDRLESWRGFVEDGESSET